MRGGETFGPTAKEKTRESLETDINHSAIQRADPILAVDVGECEIGIRYAGPGGIDDDVGQLGGSGRLVFRIGCIHARRHVASSHPPRRPAREIFEPGQCLALGSIGEGRYSLDRLSRGRSSSHRKDDAHLPASDRLAKGRTFAKLEQVPLLAWLKDLSFDFVLGLVVAVDQPRPSRRYRLCPWDRLDLLPDQCAC